MKRSGRVRTPTILQVEAAECGAAALAIVLAHHGLWLPLEELRIRCGVSRDGSRASNLAKAARGLGMEVTALRAEPADLAALGLPVVLHWGMDHFLVLEGRIRGGWRVNDPARGPRFVTDEEFDRQFTGVVLALRPGPTFQPTGRPPSTTRALAERLAGSWGATFFLLGISVLLLVPGLLLPAATQVFVDHILVGHVEGWLVPLLAGMAGLGLLTGLLTSLQLRVLLRLETRLAVSGARQFLRHVLRLPIAYFGQRQAGDVSGRVLLNDRLARLLAGDLGRAGLALIGATAYLAVMAAYDAQLAGVVFVLAAGNLLVLYGLSRRMVDDNHRVMFETALAQGEAKQGLQMLDTFKASGSESLLLSRLVGRQARLLNLRQGLGLRRAAIAGLPGALQILTAAAVLWLGGGRIMAGTMTVGALVAFQGLLAGFAGPVGQLVGLAAQLQDARATLTLLDDTLRHPLAAEFTTSGIGQGKAATRRLQGRIELRNVSFGYSPLALPLLREASLVVPVGHRLGVVGASGSGKSTLGGLMAGLHEPWAGEVLIDGRPLRDIPREALRGSLAVVDQTVVLFEGTVRENLSLWDPTLSDERLQAAARDAAVHRDIVDRLGGYGGKIAEEGRNLSGGQRARLEIARALAQDPRVLVLDEATAALDTITEAEIMDSLRRRGCTVVIIAHRPSAVRDCDTVAVLEGGRIVQCGVPHALAKEDGPFRRLMAEAA